MRISDWSSDVCSSDLLYAQAEVLNVRRRAEKEAADARTYAATGFARDILSVSDNLMRGLAAIPDDLRSDDKIKGLVAGLEATARELDAVFHRHRISQIVALVEKLAPIDRKSIRLNSSH